MSDETRADSPTLTQLRNDLQDLGHALRSADHLEPATQLELARLLEELGGELDPTTIPSAHTKHLAESVGRVARSLHDQHHAGLLTAARARLEEAARAAEEEAPIVTGIVRRFIDVLASIGI